MPNMIDVARGAYARLPPRARSRLASVLRYVPTDLKYGGTYRDWRERIAAARNDPDLVQAHQRRCRTAILDAAFSRSPYYREILTETFGSGFQAADVLDVEAWSRIPILSSAAVMANSERMCTVARSRLDVSTTGGTSGRPIRFFLDNYRSPVEYAFVHDAWARAGYRAGDARCVFRGTQIDDGDEIRFQYDPGLAELRCSVFHLSDDVMERYANEIRSRGIRFIHGYASAIAIFASFLHRSGLASQLPIQGVFPISERIYPHYRAEIERTFPNACIVPFYGLSEKAAFATEVSGAPDEYEFEPLYGYTELLAEDGEQIREPGQVGRIIASGLLFPGMPFIRYDTGDDAEFVAAPSRANGYRLKVRRITPRRGQDFFVTRSGGLVPLVGVISNAHDMVAFRELQFVQETPGQAILKVVPFDRASPDLDRYVEMLNRKTGGELDIRLEVVEALALTPRGKRKFIDQRLDLASLNDLCRQDAPAPTGNATDLDRYSALGAAAQ